MSAVTRIKVATQRLQDATEKLSVLTAGAVAAEKAYVEASKERQELEAERAHLRSSASQVTKELDRRHKQMSSLENGMEDRNKALSEIDAELQQIEKQITEYTTETKSPLVSTLTEDERNELQSLEAEERQVRNLLTATEAEMLKVSSLRDSLRINLQNNILKRKKELEYRLLHRESGGDIASQSYPMGNQEDILNRLHEEQKVCAAKVKVAEVVLNDIEKQVEAKKKELVKYERNYEQTKLSEQKVQEQLLAETQNQDKLLNKRTILISSQQQKQRAIQELGTVPRKELLEFQALPEKSLLKKLHTVNNKLKKYASVNRKALDQYVSFSAQRESLLSRKEEIKTR